LFPDVYVHEALEPDAPTIEWFNNSGEPMQPRHWQEHHARTLGYLISVKHPTLNTRVRMLSVFHAGRDAVSFMLPILEGLSHWEILLDTASFTGQPDPDNCRVDSRLNLFSCSTVVLLAHLHTPHSETEGVVNA
ncbi:MAG: hypothetical protein Q8L06_15535, partial [Pseudohongiella sp.]|nr:hypothetical protein [Pseudohongiella sp.]